MNMPKRASRHHAMRESRVANQAASSADSSGGAARPESRTMRTSAGNASAVATGKASIAQKIDAKSDAVTTR